MSFRELRDATEILRSLGYPRLISIENFRTSNFPLIAEILTWIVQKFDSNTRLPRHLDNETERVMFIKGVVLTLLQKAHVRLNPKFLYQADGHAIRELLPVLRMLYESVKEQKRSNGTGGSGGKTAEDGAGTVQINVLRSQVNAKRQELHQTVKLATELPKTAASLYELLREEIFAKEVRTKALGRPLNAAQVETELRERIQTTEQRIEEVKERLQNIESDEQELSRKIERRRREMDQLQKRLAKLQAFRPPYLDEYERYEAQLRVRYAVYVILFRNLHALQSRLVQSEHAEREQALEAERSMREMVEKMRMDSEQAAPLIAGIPLHIGELKQSADDELEEYGQNGRQRRPGEVRVFGNMTGLGLSDDDDEEDEEEDEDGLGGGRIIEMDDDGELDDDDDDDDNDDYINNFIRGGGNGSTAAAAAEENTTKRRRALIESKKMRQGNVDEEETDEEAAADEDNNSGDNF
ncbi:hypothetical protein niasHT_002126 [Heterodera trifolii]|uniref:Clusterin-associated protein 1 n=1 Tax=Heterodera trifolii TaxID=157864 RepID=A0ABD2MDM6_9BILA